MGCQILVDAYIEKITKDFNVFNNKLKQQLIIKEIIEWFQFISMITLPIIIYTYYYL